MDTPEIETPETPETESFDAIFAEFERTHPRNPPSTDGNAPNKQINATVVSITADSVLCDIGFKTEGIFPLALFTDARQEVKVGDQFPVSVKGRDTDGYYELSRIRVAQVKDWTSLEQAFEEKATITGTVTAMVKGGFTVDVGLRAFMPASRSGVREAADMEKLVGQEIRCRITKLDVEDEDLVVDRRVISEEEDRLTKDRRYGEINEGDIVHGTIRSLAPYGAFVEIGGVDALLHISDIAWQRIANPSDLLTVGQEVQAKVLKVEPATRRISVGLKQLLSHPWDAVPDTYTVGQRVTGTISRLTDFGAFVELTPGVEGMVHVSEMSWVKKVRKPADMLKLGEQVEVVILGINPAEKRLALGLKQALGDPWATAADTFPIGSVIEGPITSFTKFGAFVQLTEGIEGMIHVSEIPSNKRIETPQEVLKLNQIVKAQVIAFDRDRRTIGLSIKQMIPSSFEEYIGEHHAGDKVTGRIITITNNTATIELGEGIRATCTLPEAPAAEATTTAPALDLSALTSMLNNRWKGNTTATSTPTAETPQPGQIRSFTIATLNAEAKQITLNLT